MVGRQLHDLGTKRYIVVSKMLPPIELTYIIDHRQNYLWCDTLGTIWAIRDGEVADPIDQCGIGFWSWRRWLPWFKKLTRACLPHEFMYACPAAQAFYSRLDADLYLKFLIEQGEDGSVIMGEPFKDLSRELGDEYWENPETNN